jgi:hypothetical protein
MPFPTLTSDGLSIVCLLVPHDWTSGLSVAHYFPVDVAEGLTGRKGRRPEAEALLLTAAVKITAQKAEAQALLEQLATLGKSWVGVPVWGDQFLGAEAAAALGTRIYQPQRLIDLTLQAIVAGDSVLVPDHTYAPLIVGHITELPKKIKPLKGDAARCDFTLTEDSPWVFRIGSIVTPAAGTFPDGLRPDWSTPPTITPVHGLQFTRIGYQREQQIDGEERAFHWESEASFSLFSKTAAATLLGFFIASRGPWKAFTAPMWFTPGEASAEAPASTKFCFASETLTFDFSTPRCITATTKFTQVPWEIAGVSGETPERPSRIYYYRITHTLPAPKIWRFTNCWRPLTRTGDGTYAVGPFLHDQIVGTDNLRDPNVTLQSFEFPGNPFGMFNPFALEKRLVVEIFEGESEPINPDAAVFRWAGYVESAPSDGRTYKASLSWLGNLLDRELPSARVARQCQVRFFSDLCGHLKSAWQRAGTLVSADGNTLVLTSSASDAADTYRGGWIEVGSGDDWEMRRITASAPVSGGQQLTIDLAIRQAAAAQAVIFYRSCDRSRSTCKLLDPTGWKSRYHGFDYIPKIALQIPGGSTAEAGKKT